MRCLDHIVVALTWSTVTGFHSTGNTCGQRLTGISESTACEQSRHQFVQNVGAAVVGAAATLFLPLDVAVARGRATLEYTYERYVPRILAGAEFYKSDFQAMVAKADWQAINDALAEPPKKTKEDRAKDDGGVAARAAQTGRFSDARVLVACDLFASAFSDNSISPKTKKMKANVEELREIVKAMQLTAREGLGEDVGAGGLFGFGAKKATPDELRKRIRELYVKGGTEFNQYIFAANEDLAVRFQKLPYL